MRLIQRGRDQWGSGEYFSSRGNRVHNGVDIRWHYEDSVVALCDGLVTKIGYPYDPHGSKGHFRYVEVSDCAGSLARYFYVDPIVEVGYMLKEGDVLGSCQDLEHTYPGITNHFHFEVLVYVNRKKVYLNPVQYLEALGHELS